MMKCFVITPIGDGSSDIRRHIDGIIDQAIIPALQEKYEVEVAHRKFEIGSINDRVIKDIYNADLVVANLTNLNPNVMFELAMRYSFAKPAIVIAEDGTKLPFDIVDENTIFYINDPSGANELKNQIKKFEENIEISRKYGPIYKAISTIPLYEEVEQKKDVSSEKMLSYIIDRLNYIENNIANNMGSKKNQRKEYIEIQLAFEECKDVEIRENIISMLLEKYGDIINIISANSEGINVGFTNILPRRKIDSITDKILMDFKNMGIEKANSYYIL